jgi:hypothetical protein
MPLLLSYGPEGIAKVLLVRGAISCVLIAGMRCGDAAAQECSVFWTRGSHTGPVFICPGSRIEPPCEAE